jgi:hypothetical protein
MFNILNEERGRHLPSKCPLDHSWAAETSVAQTDESTVMA